MKYKYIKEELEVIVLRSITVSDVMRKLGMKINGGSHKYLSNVIKKYNIDTKHFLGRASTKGRSFYKKPWNQVLVYNTKNKREAAYLLRRALIESGREYKCCHCGLKDIWNSKKIILEVHHKNNNCLDNNKENLEFLCPNCHSQETQSYFKSIKKKSIKTKKCLTCTAKISKKAKRCKSCVAKLRGTKINWPDTEELKEMLNNSSYCEVGRQLGVSDNAVRKRLKISCK